MKNYKIREKCASCNSKNFQDVLELGIVPMAGYFPTKEQLDIQLKFPLKLLFCKDCKLVQTDSIIDPDILFKDYRYKSSIGLSGHFKEVANILDKKYSVTDKNILEIGCNDGVLLEPLKKLGANVEGVDPATNIIQDAIDKGLKVYNTYFNYNTFGKDEFKDKYDLVLANNSFAHITDVQSVVKGVVHVLKPQGDFVFEVHYLKSLFGGMQWDNIYHEHIYYYSVTALQNLLSQSGMTIVDYEEIPIHAGCIRITATNEITDIPEKVKLKLEEESQTITNPSFLSNFTTNVNTHIKDFNLMIKDLSEKYIIGGYGASGRANMFCNLTELDENVIQFIVDESPERCGRYIANTKIPIVDVDTLKNSDVDLIIIFAWNFSKMIIEKTQFKKFKYLVAFPKVQLVDSYEELEGFDSI